MMNNLSKLIIEFILINWVFPISYGYKLNILFDGFFRLPCYIVKINITGIYVYLTTRNAGLVGGLFSGGVFSGSSSS